MHTIGDPTPPVDMHCKHDRFMLAVNYTLSLAWGARLKNHDELLCWDPFGREAHSCLALQSKQFGSEE